MSGLGMAAGGRRPDQVFLSAAKKNAGPSEQRAREQPGPAAGRASPRKKKRRNHSCSSKLSKKARGFF